MYTSSPKISVCRDAIPAWLSYPIRFNDLKAVLPDDLGLPFNVWSQLPYGTSAIDLKRMDLAVEGPVVFSAEFRRAGFKRALGALTDQEDGYQFGLHPVLREQRSRVHALWIEHGPELLSAWLRLYGRASWRSFDQKMRLSIDPTQKAGFKIEHQASVWPIDLRTHSERREGKWLAGMGEV
jgi:hypothetical protein